MALSRPSLDPRVVPDAPYVPLLHPMAGLLLEAGLNEEEVNTHFKENLEQNRSLI